MGILSSIFGAKALKRGEKKALGATTEANAKAQEQYNPYSAVTDKALPAYADAVGLGDSQAAIDRFRNSPYYKLTYDAAMKAGTDGVTAMGTAAGTRNSGATLKALQDRGAEITDSAFGQYVNPLAGLNEVGMGIADKRVGLITNQGDAEANFYRNKSQIKAGKFAGFDNLIGGALKLAGGFAMPGGMQGLSEKFGFAKSIY